MTLSITGFRADPARVSDLLRLRPTGTTVIGQPRGDGRGRPYNFNGWWLTIRSRMLEGRGVDHAEAIAEVVALLRGREALFRRLHREIKPERVHLYGSMAVPWDEQCGLWLDVADMAVLAECGIGWGVDLHATARDEGP